MILIALLHKENQPTEGHSTIALPNIRSRSEILTSRKLKETNTVTEIHKQEHNYQEQLPIPPVTIENNGYIFVESLEAADLPVAVAMLLHIQCWSKSMQMDIVQPSVSQHGIMTPLHQASTTKSDILPLDNIFNMASWSRIAETKEAPPFIDGSQVIVNHIDNVLVIDVDSKYKNNATSLNCMEDSVSYRASIHSTHGLQITQELCIENDKTLSEILQIVKDFVQFLQSQQQRIASAKPQTGGKTVVIFRRLGSGMVAEGGDEKQDSCRYSPMISSRISPSEKLTSDAQRYIKNTFETSSSISGILLSPKVSGLLDVPLCYERILTHFHTLRLTHNVTSPFLAILPPTGTKSKRATPPTTPSRKLSYKMFLRALYQGTPTQVDEKIQKYSSVQNEVYRNLLKLIISSHSKCLILTSSDIYTELTRNWYNELHQTTGCIFTIKECLSVAAR